MFEDYEKISDKFDKFFLDQKQDFGGENVEKIYEAFEDANMYEAYQNRKLGLRERSQKIYGYSSILGACMINMFSGIIYLWGNVVNYVISYYHFQHDPHATHKIAIIIVPISYCIINILAPIGPFLLARFHEKLVITAGSAIMILSILAASYMKSFVWFIVFYGICMPIGMNIYFNSTMVCAAEWFP